MSKKEAIDFLPLGSIVILRGGTQKVVVQARGLVTMLTEPPCYFDYGGSLYPQGLVGDQILYFNHEDIIKVVFEGYKDEDDELMIDNLNEWFLKSTFERGKTREFIQNPEQLSKA